MPRRRDLALTLGVLLAGATAAAEPATPPASSTAPPGGPALFDLGGTRSNKEPIYIASDTLEYDYKANVVVYRGNVQASQGDVKLRSDTLTVTLESNNDPNAKPAAGDANAKPGAGDATAAKADPPAAKGGPGDPGAAGGPKLRQIVAVGNVRIDNGTKWATGGRAVFEQSKRTVVLTEQPVMHDGKNEVAGDRVVVFLDENRSVVEGGGKRVKAVLYPGQNGGLAPAGGAPAPAGAQPATAGGTTSATAEAAAP
jgi:lipopolysaccharide export system protein LptA